MGLEERVSFEVEHPPHGEGVLVGRGRRPAVETRKIVDAQKSPQARPAVGKPISAWTGGRRAVGPGPADQDRD
jgi:hypothetical protein